jgi:hypothetical protein
MIIYAVTPLADIHKVIVHGTPGGGKCPDRNNNLRITELRYLLSLIKTNSVISSNMRDYFV